MKLASRTIIIVALSLAFVNIQAQQPKELKKVLELKIPEGDGANGASVAWHPVLKKYYAAMAGNTSYFIGVFDSKGKLLNPITQEAYFDVRGLWYNPNTKTLQMNGYNDFGWAEYKLDSKGFPTGVKNLFEGMHQPDEQVVGVFDPKEKVVYFFNGDGNLEKYIYSTGEYLEEIELYLGRKNEDDEGYGDNYDVLEDYNSSAVIYTGQSKSEIGLLNHLNGEIELYDLKTGYLTRKLKLPGDAPLMEFLNFSYSNGIYWLFDKSNRKWLGYK